jgi:transposase
MPPKHQAHAGMTAEGLLATAGKIGPATSAFMRGVIDARAHPQQAFRSCLGVLRLGKSFGDDRLEAACNRAVTLGSFTFKSVDAILKHGLDQQPLERPPAATTPKQRHENVRGSAYYTPEESRN